MRRGGRDDDDERDLIGVDDGSLEVSRGVRWEW